MRTLLRLPVLGQGIPNPPFTSALGTRMNFDPAAATADYINSLGPDALAKALVKTAEYRDPRPDPLQEILFYTHPSVESRVLRAMEWKAAHPAR